MATNMKSLNGYGFDASALGGHDASHYATTADIQQIRNEIPTELPNPNALTINGQSYDGSAAVNITITGGDGGANIDDTTPSTSTTYSSSKIESELSALNEANATQDEEIAKRAKDADLAAVAKSGSYNDLTDKPTIPTVPSALPNPNKLKLTGAVTAEYDGSSEVSVEIPAGGGSSYELPIASPTTLGGVKPAAKTDEMTQAVGVDADGKLFTAPGSGGGSSTGSTWDLLINHEVAEDCVTVDFYNGDNGETLSDYEELIILMDLFPNSAGYTTGIKLSFLSSVKPWDAPFFFVGLNGYVAGDSEVYNIRTRRFVKTGFGILPDAFYTQYNNTTLSNSQRLSANSTTNSDFLLPINPKTHMTLDVTNFNAQTEFEAVRIGGYQAVLGAGTIIKVWGRRA